MSTFGTNIKFLRKRQKRTQDDIAFSLEMKRSTLSGYENGVAQPSISTLIKFSAFFKIAIDTLVKVDLSTLSEYKISQVERGFDIYVDGTNIRVLAATIDQDNNENI